MEKEKYQLEWRSPDQVTPYIKNPRKNDKTVETVARSIQQYGFQQPLVVDRDGVIIVGHTRHRAAKKLKLQSIPVVVATDLTAEQVKAYRIMDNRSAEDSRWDDQMLFEELNDLLKDHTLGELGDQTGFREAELNRLFDSQGEQDLSKYTRETIFKSRQGDLWILGNHRLLNGDSTDPNNIKRLMGEDRIDCIWQDPPYGIAYRSAGGINHTAEVNDLRDHLIANDALKIDALLDLMRRQIQAMRPHLRPGAAVYWCHDIRFNTVIRDLLEDQEIHVADTLIWKKNAASTWLTDYAKFYEPIFYGWVRGAQHEWHGKGMTPNAIQLDQLESLDAGQLREIIRSQVTNYQEFSREPLKIASLHPTVKPAQLIAHHLINSTQPGYRVFDGFAGSGSTLIACEQTQRHARVVEYEPRFADVIIQRWQERTGERAQHEDGSYWDER